MAEALGTRMVVLAVDLEHREDFRRHGARHILGHLTVKSQHHPSARLIGPPGFHILAPCGGHCCRSGSRSTRSGVPSTAPPARDRLQGSQGSRAERQVSAPKIARLSEPGGSFDTDNLISNERAYLDVIPTLVSRGVTGGAYIGVGPDQNFSYIARIRPSVAFIVDVRRDNLLLHLLFKALFAQARSRVEYLSLLTGRAPPSDPAAMAALATAPLKTIVSYVDAKTATPDSVPRARALRQRLDETIASFGVPMSRADMDTIHRFHQAFVDAGLGLQFHSFNRAPQPYYPTFRDLLLATDASGHEWNYLDTNDDFQFLRALEGRDAVIPVVGDVAGPHAMRAIGAAMGERGDRLSALYISNVENYLFRDGVFPRYADNLSHLPRGARSVVIRSVFSGGGESISRVQPLDQMLGDISRGSYRTYNDLVGSR